MKAMKILYILALILVLGVSLVSAGSKSMKPGYPLYLCGDIYRDSRIDSLDSTIAAHVAAGIGSISEESRLLGDINNNGRIDIIDALQIQRYSLRLIPSLDCAYRHI